MMELLRRFVNGGDFQEITVAGWARSLFVGMGAAGLLLVTGCQTTPTAAPSAADSQPYAGSTIQIGDVVKVTFPGATNLNFAQQVRVDGVLNLGQAGETKAVDKTPKDLEAELLKIYGPDLVIKEVNVQLESAGFPVFVSGAVLRPGKVLVNRSVTVMEAIMEAGGFDATRAELRKVQVIRQEGGVQRTFTINVKDSLNLSTSKPFHLRPSDIVVVPERFVFF
jgi:protein involved in polysaccharide export with SLBB domain